MTDTDTIAASCHDCGEAYGSPRFPDLVLPHDMWARISPSGDENGLLCPNCTCARAEAAGIECRAVFRSGPFSDASGTHEAMNAQPDTIARLTAELAEARRERDAALAVAVEVRELEWAGGETYANAECVTGEYIIESGKGAGAGMGWWAWLHRTHDDGSTPYFNGTNAESIEAAKAAAQADYRARIVAALRPSPDALQAVTANG